MSGVSLMNRVKKAGVGSEFIIYTGSFDTAMLRDFFHSGGLDYWLQPFSVAEAEKTIEKLTCKLTAEYG
jgi:response regulator of citrate/malate metabolism